MWILYLTKEGIDVLIRIKGKLTKEEKRHLDGAIREK